MNVNGAPAPAAVLGVSVTGPTGASGAIDTSARRLAADGPQTSTVTPGTLDAIFRSPSRYWPSRVSWNLENRLPKFGVTLPTAGGFGFSGSGSPVALPLAVSIS